jgi:hypothetical protein
MFHLRLTRVQSNEYYLELKLGGSYQLPHFKNNNN